MPAKATLYNIKCDPIFEFEPAHRNAAFYNSHGNLLALAGFGNLRGKIEVWDVETKKQLAAGDCPDTTELKWCPDGKHFTVATCAPRLREVSLERASIGHAEEGQIPSSSSFAISPISRPPKDRFPG